MLVYSEKRSNRLTYILRTLLLEGLGVEFKQTTDVVEFGEFKGPKIAYATGEYPNAIQIKPEPILFEHGIKDYHLEVSQHPALYRIFFKNSGKDLPFDIFAASFWLLSRYEEYLPHKTDKHNRFQYKNSLAYQYDFLDKPLINYWLEALRELLHHRFPEQLLQKRKYNFISTVDVDAVYKYKFKGFVRSVAGLVSDKQFSKMRRRLRIMLGREKDPFDCYDFILELHRQTNSKLVFFFLLGDYGPNDKNHSATDLRFQKLIKHVADYAVVGLHPSFRSNAEPHQLRVELSRLGNITHRFVNRSRQHFSMLRFPDTYFNLEQSGLTNDFSMGYPDHNGFRASYCYPFKWFNIDKESVSSLTVHSYSVSDYTLIEGGDHTASQMTHTIEGHILLIKKFGGEFVTLFRNENFTNEICEVYEKMVKASVFNASPEEPL
jgi:hypothetical protein